MSRQPPFDAALLERLPGVLAIPLQEFATANLPELRLHRLCDVFEVVTRFCTVLAVAEVRLPDDARKLPDQLVKEFGPNIQTPTFGRWLGMAKGAADFLAGDRSNPMVLPELPRFICDVLLPTSPPRNQYLELGIVDLRNTLAHGGCMTGAMAEYLLHGDASGSIQGLLPSVPAEGDVEDADEAPSRPAEAGPLPGETAFHGWEPVLGKVVKALAALLEGSRLCSFDGEAARDLTGLQPSGEVVPLSADLHVTLRRLQLQGHVLLFRDGRWLDLWPLCDHGKARLMSLRGRIESEGDAPLLYYRGERQRLLYAAFGTTPPVSERDDAVADFRALFRPDQRQEAGPQAALNFADELQSDANQMIGRATELQRILEVLDETRSGVLWLYGTGGVGKSFLTARVAVKRGTDPRRWCCIPWRFRVSDADRSNRNTFLRHAVARLAAWKPLGRTEVQPDLDSNKLPAQLDDLLRAAGSLAPGRDGKPPRVLFVLDGMDEVARLSPELLEWPFRVAYANVVWLCAGRPGEATSKVFAPDRCRHLFPGGLPPMSTGDVRAMLYQQLGEQKYELLGLDRRDESGDVTNPLVEAIVARSEGLPLYVHFLVEDLLTGHFELTRHLKSKLPQGLAAFYDDLLGRVQIDDVQAILPKLLGAIVWARGPVAGELLFELLRRLENERPEKWDRLRADIRQALLRAASLVRPGPLPEGEFGYLPCHTTFQDHFRTSSTRLGRTNDQARDAFVRLTNDWRNVAEAAARPYVFRHGPQHLLDGDCLAELYALAGDEAFLQAQAEELPAEPEAPLRTLQAALAAAARHDDAGGMAEFLLRHARQTQALQNESPLSALRRGNLDRALGLADLAEPERGVVHRLVLAWELCEGGRTADARRVLEHLSQRQPPRLDVRFSEFAAAILAPLGGFLPALVTELAARILASRGLALLVTSLSTRGFLELAESIAGCPMEAEDGWGSLVDLAAAQAQAGAADAARLTFERAVEAAHTLDDLLKRSTALRAVAAAQTRSGQLDSAFQSARAIEDVCYRAKALEAVAAAQARAGQTDAARLSFELAIQATRGVGDRCWEAEALGAIAAAQVQAGQEVAARVTWEQALRTVGALTAGLRDQVWGALTTIQIQAGQLEAALQTAGAIGHAIARAGALIEVATAQARAGQAEAARRTFEEALRTAGAIADAFFRGGVSKAIAEAQAQAEKFDAALRGAEAPTNPGDFEAIATAQTEKGLFDAALQTARAIRAPHARDQVLGVIAAAQARAGQAAAARQTARAIEDTARRAEVFGHQAASQFQAGRPETARLLLDVALLPTTASADETAWRARCLGAIAQAQAKAGQAEAAFQTVRAIDDCFVRARTLWAIREVLGSYEGEAEDLQAELDAGVSKYWPLLGEAETAEGGQAPTARALFGKALEAAAVLTRHPLGRAETLGCEAADRIDSGQVDGVKEMLQEAVEATKAVAGEDHRAGLLRSLACLQARAGLPEQAAAAARLILTACERHLPAVVDSLLLAKDRTGFKELLTPCAAHPASAWEVCGLLAQAYPDQASAVARVALRFAHETG
jgi:hypothetical protein